METVLLTTDLTVISRVEGAVRQHAGTLCTVSSAQQAVERCAAAPPERLIVDLSTSGLDIADLVARLDSGTERPRITAFGPHVHRQRLADAQAAGCDVVVSRGQFFAQLESLLGS